MQGLYEGKSLYPNDGILAPLMKHLLESMMDGELETISTKKKLRAIATVEIAKAKRQSEVSISELLSWRQAGTDPERSSQK